VEMVRTVYLSVRDAESTTHWYAGEFEFWEGQDRTAVTPLVSFPNDDLVMSFVVQNPTANPGDDPQARGAPAGWITQGSIDGIPTTAKFAYTWTSWARASLNTRDEAYTAHLPLRSSGYDPAKGLAWAWRQKLGNYSMMGTDPRRGPIQLILPTVAGQETNGRYSATVACRNAYINILGDTLTGSGDPIREIRILNNDGARYGNINAYVLPQSLVDQYHNWSASAVYDSASGFAYWNLWVDGKHIWFGGSDGSVAGPGGKIYSFRTNHNITGRPYLRYGEAGNTGTEKYWDMELDYLRMISLDVAGAPYWNGLGWKPEPPYPCGDLWADRDVDGDVDLFDFAELQRCYTGADNSDVWPPGHPCLCFDRDRQGDIDSVDVAAFAACGTGPNVLYDVDDLPAGCVR